jgi:hypothetical protein
MLSCSSSASVGNAARQRLSRFFRDIGRFIGFEENRVHSTDGYSINTDHQQRTIFFLSVSCSRSIDVNIQYCPHFYSEYLVFCFVYSTQR